MEGQAILALVLAAPIVLLPVAYVGYLTVGGIHAAIRKAEEKTAPREEGTTAAAETLR